MDYVALLVLLPVGFMAGFVGVSLIMRGFRMPGRQRADKQ